MRLSRKRKSSHWWLDCIVCSLVCGGLSVAVGCASDTTGPGLLPPTHLYYQLTLNHHAITMALTSPYDTLQLVATPYAASGAQLIDTSVTTWIVSDTTNVKVSPTGLLTATGPVTGVTVTAMRTIGAVTQFDTASVTVNDIIDPTQVPRMTALTVRPDSLLFGSYPLYEVQGLLTFDLGALDSHGDSIPNAIYAITSVTPAILVDVTVARGFGIPLFQEVAVGHARIRTEATVYGIRRVDTITVVVGWLQNVVVHVLPQVMAGQRTPVGAFTPAEDTVLVGGTVAWRNELSGQLVDVIFDDSAAVQAVDSATYLDGFAASQRLVIPTQGGGNIPAFAPLDTGSLTGLDTFGLRARRFSVPGTYQYHSALYGTRGTIHVLPLSQVP